MPATVSDHVEDLVRDNLQLVPWVLARVFPGFATEEDLLSAGREGLWRAARAFDPSRGCKFSTLATLTIKRFMWQAVVWAERHGGRLPTIQLRHGTDQAALGEVGREDPDRLALEEQRRADGRDVERLLAVLTPVERLVIEGTFLGGKKKTLRALGEELGYCPERVRQIKAQALRRMRQEAVANVSPMG